MGTFIIVSAVALVVVCVVSLVRAFDPDWSAPAQVSGGRLSPAEPNRRTSGVTHAE